MPAQSHAPRPSSGDELQMESPRWEQKSEDDRLQSDGHKRFFCHACGGEEFEPSDDGFFYCSQCGFQSQDAIAMGADAEDVYGGEGGVGAVYSVFHHRTKARSPHSSPKSSLNLPSKEEILRSLTQSAASAPGDDPAVNSNVFEDKMSSLQDFGYQSCNDPEKAVGAIRLRYVQGLQVMLQLQCEALVEKFGVSPMICGMAMSVWLRYVAVSIRFDDAWVERIIEEAKVVSDARFIEKSKLVEPEVVASFKKKRKSPLVNIRKGRTVYGNTYGQKAISIAFRLLRKTIPVYSTLAISFLSCHLARVAILPTDIYEWVLEAKLPYLAAFVELEKYLGTPKHFPLSSRQMFKPIQVISAWMLEVNAASIAQNIGLRTPSVNFYSIALRYLKELSLPVTKILPQACHLYEWSLPAELWLSSCNYALPTRVYVMSILMVTIRILYNVHGQGIWESLLDIRNFKQKHKRNFERNHFIPAQKDDATKPSAANDVQGTQTSEFCTKELLQVLDRSFHRMISAHEFHAEYSKDLRSYLKYCRDVIFVGLTPSYEEGKLIGRLWDLYEKKEDDNQQDGLETQFFELKNGKRDGESIFSSMDSKKIKEEKPDITGAGVCAFPNCSSAVGNAAIENIKFEMEDVGFQYLPPRCSKRDGYIHYRRRRVDGKFIYVAHADYFILLRACAKLVQVDPRILHTGVLKFEKRLDWIEKRIDESLNLLRKCSLKDAAKVC